MQEFKYYLINGKFKYLNFDIHIEKIDIIKEFRFSHLRKKINFEYQFILYNFVIKFIPRYFIRDNKKSREH